MLRGFMSIGVAQYVGRVLSLTSELVLRGFMSIGVAQIKHKVYRCSPPLVLRGFMSIGVAQVAQLEKEREILESASWLYVYRRCSDREQKSLKKTAGASWLYVYRRCSVIRKCREVHRFLVPFVLTR